MGKSEKALDEWIGLKGLKKLTVADLFTSAPILDVVTEKINTLNRRCFSENELERDARLLLEILRETLARRYDCLSVLAFAHILVALDHFICVRDHQPDTHVGGYADDLATIRAVVTEFRDEINDFLVWKRKTKPST